MSAPEYPAGDRMAVVERDEFALPQRCDNCDVEARVVWCPATHDDPYIGSRLCRDCLERALEMVSR